MECPIYDGDRIGRDHSAIVLGNPGESELGMVKYIALDMVLFS
jgi:hypothetical protein